MDTVARVIGLWLLLMAAGYVLGVPLGLIYGLISTAISKLLRFWNDHELGPKKRGAREVDEGSVATLLHELSQRAKIPTPRLYVIDSPYANASATGRNYRHSSICVTTGLLYGLGRDELAGVLSHELAHVLQRSTLTKTIAATLSAAISLLPFVGLFVGLGIDRSVLLLFIAPTAAFLIQLAISRASEYAADECGARLSGRPDALASALRIASTDDAEFGDPANNPIAKALLTFGKRFVGPRRDNPFSAYPLPMNRIAALERLSRGRDTDNPASGEL
ncbi:MAG TPA: M48 family metalloprotease [Candidatus Eremiobacteraceae bacterium]|jgi:heat shock protein HtpX|nr:M48 family metalloprotease [Candidatus Eremiobacteraceae bacterium]